MFFIILCYFNSFKSVITFIPASSQSFILVSKSRIFVDPRYKIGGKFVSDDLVISSSIGDGFCLPDANHVFSSAIQKSLLLCAAITSWLVRIKLPCIMKSLFFSVRYSITGFKSSEISEFGVMDGLATSSCLFESSSKSISENTGVKEGTSEYIGGSFSGDISKSLGRGSSPS